MPRVLTQRAVNDIGMEMSTRLKAFSVVTHRPEEWPFDIIAVFGKIETLNL